MSEPLSEIQLLKTEIANLKKLVEHYNKTPEQKFRVMDSNGDGFVTLEEYKQALENQHKTTRNTQIAAILGKVIDVGFIIGSVLLFRSSIK